jgi:hypothetical protein
MAAAGEVSVATSDVSVATAVANPPAVDRPFVAVVGSGSADPGLEAVAEEVGHRLAEAGAVVVCGGLGGVMAAACRGASAAGGTTVGLLPGDDRRAANRWVTVPLATGLGELRNGLVVRSADAVVAVGGAYGTLSEVALALQAGKPVVGVGTWGLVRPGGDPDDGVRPAGSAAEAVAMVLRGRA